MYQKLRADCFRCWNLCWLVADCTYLRAIVRSWPLSDAFLHAREFVATQSDEPSLSRVPKGLISVSLVEVAIALRESVLSSSRNLRGNFFEPLAVTAYRYFQNEWNLELRSRNAQKTGGKSVILTKLLSLSDPKTVRLCLAMQSPSTLQTYTTLHNTPFYHVIIRNIIVHYCTYTVHAIRSLNCQYQHFTISTSQVKIY